MKTDIDAPGSCVLTLFQNCSRFSAALKQQQKRYHQKVLFAPQALFPKPDHKEVVIKPLVIALFGLGLCAWLALSWTQTSAATQPATEVRLQQSSVSEQGSAVDSRESTVERIRAELSPQGDAQQQELPADRVAYEELETLVKGYLYQGVKQRYAADTERIVSLVREQGAHRANAEKFTRALREFEQMRSNAGEDETEAFELVKSYYRRYPDPGVATDFQDEEQLQVAYESALEKFEASSEAYERGERSTLAPYPIPDLEYGLGDDGEGLRCTLLLVDLFTHVRLKGSLDYAQQFSTFLEQSLYMQALTLLEGINLNSPRR